MTGPLIDYIYLTTSIDNIALKFGISHLSVMNGEMIEKDYSGIGNNIKLCRAQKKSTQCTEITSSRLKTIC